VERFYYYNLKGESQLDELAKKEQDNLKILLSDYFRQ